MRPDREPLRPGAVYLGATLGASVGLVRLLQPVLPVLLGNKVTRSALLAQLRGYTAPGEFPVLRALLREPAQEGPSRAAGRVTIGWGRQDRVTAPSQAARAVAELPGAELHWFDHCGHFPVRDRPEHTVELVLRGTR